jgi:hypothetical protein
MLLRPSPSLARSSSSTMLLADLRWVPWTQHGPLPRCIHTDLPVSHTLRPTLAAGDPEGFPVVSPWRKPAWIISTRAATQTCLEARDTGVSTTKEPGFDGETCPASSHRATFPVDSTHLFSRYLATRPDSFSSVAAVQHSPQLLLLRRPSALASDSHLAIPVTSQPPFPSEPSSSQPPHRLHPHAGET